MATEPTPVWQPDWALPPGEILLEALQERAMTQSELARRMDRPLKTINEIVKGKAAITADTAIQLERTLGISARVWDGLEMAYRAYLARRGAQRELEREAPWVDRFPIKDLVRRGLLPAGRSKAETLASLLSFFRVSSPAAWDRQWLRESVASFRASPAFVASPHAVAAWLRWGEIEAEEVPCQPFDVNRFRDALRQIRSMTAREPFSIVLERVQKLCAEAGVAVVLTPEFEGTHLSGAARWIGPDKALIQLSLRHKSDDHFWFSFFHEAAHLLQPGRRRDFVDQADVEVEGEVHEAEEWADRFARDILIPPNDYSAFLREGDLTALAVRKFAQALGIAPGIVAGRLQRDNLIAPSQLNSLKRALRWA